MCFKLLLAALLISRSVTGISGSLRSNRNVDHWRSVYRGDCGVSHSFGLLRFIVAMFGTFPRIGSWFDDPVGDAIRGLCLFGFVSRANETRFYVTLWSWRLFCVAFS